MTNSNLQWVPIILLAGLAAAACTNGASAVSGKSSVPESEGTSVATGGAAAPGSVPAFGSGSAIAGAASDPTIDASPTPTGGVTGTAMAAGGSTASMGGSTAAGGMSAFVDGTSSASTASTSPAAVVKPTQDTAGRMTAGTWDDNLNFTFYQSYLDQTAASQLQGMPSIDRSSRIVVLVKTADGQPVAGAKVSATASAGETFSSTTGAEGRVLFFPGWSGVATSVPVTITATLGTDVASQTVPAASGTVELTLTATPWTAVAALDLAFVVDTTGSMMDELSYLQTELDAIVAGIATQSPGVDQRWALVVYRDQGDQYVVRSFDFTSNLATFRQTLAAQSSDGGGDMPEAVDQGLAAANQLSWRSGPVARAAFWIADAPQHTERAAAVAADLVGAATEAIHIYPVAASGIDDLGEFTMRTAAEVTGGRYLFLTDDSGIGDSHQEPHIPCYYVTSLASAMRRMVAIELTGVYVEPAATEIIRTGGDPQSRLCTLADGSAVTAW